MQWILQNLNRCLLMAFVIYGAGAVAFLWRIDHYPALAPAIRADGVVILTGGAERVDEGLKTLQTTQAKRALVSGVHRDVKLSELLTLHHMPSALAGQIDLGFGAVDTAGNAAETAKWVQAHGIQTLIVVTSHYHMPRALLHLQSVLPAAMTLYPLAVTPPVLDAAEWYRNPQAWGILFLAYNKYLLTWPEILLWRYKH